MKVSIFCGGTGKRFWPLSRRSSPKQVQQIFNGSSTLQFAYRRVQPFVEPEDILVSTSFSFFDEIKEQLPDLPEENLIGEPAFRDLGPAVALNAAIISQIAGEEEFFAIIWSDHIVEKRDLFREMLRKAEEELKNRNSEIIFFGCLPRFANETLGWMALDRKLRKEGVTVAGLESFKYRPPKEQAKKFFDSGRHAWNLGYFVSTPRFILGEFKKQAPGIYEKAMEITRHWGERGYRQILEEVYPTMERISFDNAVLEKLDFTKARALVADLGWSDIGTLYAFKEQQVGTEKNLLKGDVIDKGSKDVLVYNATEDQFVATAGLEGVVVVATDDAIMVCGRDEVRRIKEIVNDLEEQGRKDLI